MNELRQVEKAVEKYEKDLSNSPRVIKQDLNIFQDDVEILIAFLDTFIKFSRKHIKNWERVFNENYLIPEINPFSVMKKSFWFRVAEYYLKKCNKELEKAGGLRKKLEFIQKKMEQYQYFS